MVSKKAISELEKTIEEMTLQELIAVQAGLKERITIKQGEERDSFVSEMKQKAEQLGFNLGELFGPPPRAPRERLTSSRSTGERASPAPKYKDPKSGATWSGRGRDPRWMTAYLAEGKKKEDFLIK